MIATYLPFWLFVGVVAGIYIIMSLGLYLQFALTGLPNFGHSAFMSLAAYSMAIAVIRFGVSLPVASVIGLMMAAAFGLLLGIPVLRLSGDYLAIVTIAASEIIRYLAINMQDLTGGSIGSLGMGGADDLSAYSTEWDQLLAQISTTFNLSGKFGSDRDLIMLLIVWALALLCLCAFWFMTRSPWGRLLRAIREDEVAVFAVGKNVIGYKLQVLVIGAILGGLGGLLLAFQIGVFSPDDFLPTLTFNCYLILILGGTNRIWTIPFGSILFSSIYSGTRFLNFYPVSLIDSGDRAYLRLFIVGFLLIVINALRPQGLMGNRRELMIDS